MAKKSLSVKCPECLANIDEPCHDNGKARISSHFARVDAAKAEPRAQRSAPAPVKPKIHGWRASKYQPDPAHTRLVVDCQLYHTFTTCDVFWSERFNSYVLVEVNAHDSWLGKPECDRYYWKDPRSSTGYVDLVSINGAGEVRWNVEKYRLEHRISYVDDEQVKAAKHFGLI